MRAWDRKLNQILAKPNKAKQSPAKPKKTMSNKILINKKTEENNEVIAYEQFLKNNKLQLKIIANLK